jgi:hypothetical protein
MSVTKPTTSTRSSVTRAMTALVPSNKLRIGNCRLCLPVRWTMVLIVSSKFGAIKLMKYLSEVYMIPLVDDSSLSILVLVFMNHFRCNVVSRSLLAVLLLSSPLFFSKFVCPQGQFIYFSYPLCLSGFFFILFSKVEGERVFIPLHLFS